MEHALILRGIDSTCYYVFPGHKATYVLSLTGYVTQCARRIIYSDAMYAVYMCTCMCVCVRIDKIAIFQK